MPVEYDARYIEKNDHKAMAEAAALLARKGLQMDKHLERTLGLYDQGGKLVATGSVFANTLRCLAVDQALQGEGLMAMLVTRLVEDLFLVGISHVFVYTKPQTERMLAELGFYPIARVPGSLSFMENRRDGFNSYLEQLGGKAGAGTAGAIIMNANPFTRGHRYLAEQAAGQCDTLHLFIVSEDVSFFPFTVRKCLVMAGTEDIKNIVYHDTGSYLISRAVFPAYFLKEEEAVTQAQARLDAVIFARVAAQLGITRRFVGEEPFSPATRLYNQAMGELLPASGISLSVIPRMADASGIPISATRVRKALAEGDHAALRLLLPDSSHDFVTSIEGQALVSKRLAT
ncbi:MAG: [citrate (pro-3S)-lyase] ligase [Christensenellales bacterium]|jgi:[citrate (pro-3S)-lyase] ligase